MMKKKRERSHRDPFKNVRIFGGSVMLFMGCLFCLYHLHAHPESTIRRTPQTVRVSDGSEKGPSEAAPDISSDFYQTIIRNNLFAPLGTVFNRIPIPGANLKLIATFTHEDPTKVKAIVKNTATGEQKTVSVGDTIAGYKVRDIQAKQILLTKDNEPAVWKRMDHFLLN